MKPARALANIVGPMLFVQVILGGSATLLGFPIDYHIYWGSITFVVLLITTIIGAREYGRSSNLVKVGVAAMLDFILQAFLGFAAFSSDTLVVVHLANAFILGTLITYYIIFADNADKAASAKAMPAPAATQG